MNNRERFTKAIHWEPVDRILTYDYLDNTNILRKYGGYDDFRKYTFEELVELNVRAWKNIGVDVRAIEALLREGRPVFKTIAIPDRREKARILYSRIGPEIYSLWFIFADQIPALTID